MHKPPAIRGNDKDAWLAAVIRAIEQIALSSVANGHRIIGFTAPERHSAVSTVARSTAEVFANSGLSTLYIDLTRPVEKTPAGPIWSPGEDDPKRCIFRRNDGADRLVARPTAGTQSAFNNVTGVRQSLAKELAEYSKIVIDIPPILEVTNHQINPIAAAAACDAVLMICVRGQLTHQQITQAMEMIRSAGGKITGTVLNEIGYATTGADFARIARRVFRSAPRIAHWLERKALDSDLLN